MLYEMQASSVGEFINLKTLWANSEFFGFAFGKSCVKLKARPNRSFLFTHFLSYTMEKVSTKEAFNKFKPESCVFVISIDENRKPSGMIAGWNMKCSIEPPLFAVSLSKKGHTHKLIQQSKEFVIAVPNKELKEAVLLFGSTHGNEVDKFAESKIETAKAEFVKSPLIKNATINFECKLFKEVDSGDHIIFIGKILASYINRDKKVLLNMKKVDGKRVFEEF